MKDILIRFIAWLINIEIKVTQMLNKMRGWAVKLKVWKLIFKIDSVRLYIQWRVKFKI